MKTIQILMVRIFGIFLILAALPVGWWMEWATRMGLLTGILMLLTGIWFFKLGKRLKPRAKNPPGTREIIWAGAIAALAAMIAILNLL